MNQIKKAKLFAQLRNLRKFKENLPPMADPHYKNSPSNMSHAVYNLKDIENIQFIHYKPVTFGDKYSF